MMKWNFGGNEKQHSRMLVALVLVFAMMLSLVACSSTPLNDKGFIQNVQKGLEARWKLSQNQAGSYASNTEKKESYTQAVNAELKAIGDIAAYTFENAELKELAEAYNKALQSQLEGVKYLGSDDAMFNKIYMEDGYYQRARVICKLVDNFGLTVSKTYGYDMDQLVSAGKARLALDEKIAAMEGIFANDVVLTCLGRQKYELTITNTTKYDLSGVEIQFNFYDDNGVIIENENTYLLSWSAGSTNQDTIYLDKEFTKAEVRLSLYDFDQLVNLETSFHPVKYVNDIKIKSEEKLAAMEGIFANDVVLTCLGGREHGFTLTNNTEYDLSGVKVQFNFYDDKGAMVESESTYLRSWPAGNTSQDTIYVDKEFTKAEVRLSLYDYDQSVDLETSFYPVKYVNDMKIEIVLKNELPCEISYLDWYKKVDSTCKITGFEYVEGHWNNGEASVTVKLSGTKTYDKEGDSNSRAVRVGWKLYDSDGIVVDSGTILSSSIAVGESFKGASGYLTHLTPGTYTLELVDPE